ncbi:MAG: glycosyltransferase family 2 protein [Candidatus Hydrothermarchaeota archaeon]
MKVSVVIPAYNEERFIGNLLEKIPKKYQIIVVDDGSTDNTSKEAQIHDVEVIRHDENKGKGEAIKTGLGKANGDVVVFMDADFQHDPSHIERIIEPILRDEADVVIGSRLLSNYKGMPYQRRLSNWISSLTFRLITGLEIRDVLCGYRAFKKDALSKIDITGSRYEVEMEMLIKAAKSGLRIKEVPIEKKYGEEKSNITILDFLRTIKKIIELKRKGLI